MKNIFLILLLYINKIFSKTSILKPGEILNQHADYPYVWKNDAE